MGYLKRPSDGRLPSLQYVLFLICTSHSLLLYPTEVISDQTGAAAHRLQTPRWKEQVYHQILKLMRPMLCFKKILPWHIILKDKAGVLCCWLDVPPYTHPHTHTHTISFCSYGVRGGTVVTAVNLGGQRRGFQTGSGGCGKMPMLRWGWRLWRKGHTQRGACVYVYVCVCVLWAHLSVIWLLLVVNLCFGDLFWSFFVSAGEKPV